jgi:hypothetical protein
MSPARYVKGPSGFVDLSPAASPSTFPTITSLGTERTSTTDPTLTTVSAATSATGNTKGDWTQIIASSPAAAQMLTLLYGATSLSSGSGLALADIGIGSAGNEQVLVANVPIGSAMSNRFRSLDIPIAVPQGSRISVRWQSARTSANAAQFIVALRSIAGFTAPTSVDTLGADTATSGGVVLTGTANTFTQIVSSSARAYQGLVFGIMSSRGNLTHGTLALDLGIGAAGNETTIMRDEYFTSTTTEDLRPDWFIGSSYTAIDIPAGSRIAVKHHIVPGGSLLNYNVVLLGVPA